MVVELKLGQFKPGYKGQMELYLRWLDKYEREPGEASPLGIILCAQKDDDQIELLELGASGIHVAEYLTVLPSRELMRKKLHAAIKRKRGRIYLTQRRRGETNLSPIFQRGRGGRCRRKGGSTVIVPPPRLLQRDRGDVVAETILDTHRRARRGRFNEGAAALRKRANDRRRSQSSQAFNEAAAALPRKQSDHVGHGTFRAYHSKHQISRLTSTRPRRRRRGNTILITDDVEVPKLQRSRETPRKHHRFLG